MVKKSINYILQYNQDKSEKKDKNDTPKITDKSQIEKK
jgi:hypothetical protein